MEHFYFIDNGSTDRYQDILAQFGDTVTLFVDAEKHSQEKHYNKYVLPLKQESTWLMIIDLDEFIYSRKQFDTVSDYLRSLQDDVASVSMPMKMFGSSNHIEQPPTVVDHFLYRLNTFDEHLGWWKQIVKTKYLKVLRIHDHSVVAGHKIRSDNEPFRYFCRSQPMDEAKTLLFLDKSLVHINHYKIQSYNWFMQVKYTRGAADWKGHEDLRNAQYFHSNDNNQEMDDELVLKRLQTIPKKQINVSEDLQK